MKEIPLTQGQVALVDDEDYEWLNNFSWHYAANTGAIRNRKIHEGPIGSLYMHREILEHHNINIVRLQVDHINGINTDNRKLNLRPATAAQNLRNIFKYGSKGVRYEPSKRKWRARIGINRKQMHLAYFATEIEAIEAYNKAATKYYGPYARLNIVLEEDEGHGTDTRR